jgi:ParB-like chromosome segregation protein Spo0J
MNLAISPQIELLLAKNLRANLKNPRNHSKKQVRQIAESIRRFGFNVPILIDRHGMIVAGHGRLLACELLDIAEVPVIRLEHLSEAEAKAFTIADNKLTENAEWNETLLAECFFELQAMDLAFDLEVTGFETAEIDLMIEGATSVAEPEESIPEPEKEAVISKKGDLWTLGDHRLLCGDALNENDYQHLMGSDKARMVFTDPPYNVPIDGHVGGLGKIKHREFAMANGEMSAAQFTQFLKTAFANTSQVSVDGSLHYICMDWRHLKEVLEAGNANYTELKNICVWAKDNAGMGSLYRSQHEMVLVFKHGKASHINTVELGKHGRYRTNVWNYAGACSFARNTKEGTRQALQYDKRRKIYENKRCALAARKPMHQTITASQ